MRATFFNVLIILILSFFFTEKAFAQVTISFSSSTVIQGEPVLLQIHGTKLLDINKVIFKNKVIPIFTYNSLPSGLIGIDLYQATGTYPIKVLLKNGTSTTINLLIQERKKYEAPLAVPDKLGGNSAENQTKVVGQLSKENSILASIFTGKKSFWSKPFQYPIKNPIVTDEYGYSRLTGVYTIAHKGVDFRAEKGTKVTAINRGVVRIAREFSVYGKTVVVDHGFGVMSFYMHLSKIKVNVGELVLPGQLIGLSGDTGYAEFPHLHLTIRIGGISIDPVKFLNLFQ